jgi:hypothetical protein
MKYGRLDQVENFAKKSGKANKQLTENSRKPELDHEENYYDQKDPFIDDE